MATCPVSRTGVSLGMPTRLPHVEAALLSALEAAVPTGVHSRPSDRLGHAHDASHFLLTPRPS